MFWEGGGVMQCANKGWKIRSVARHTFSWSFSCFFLFPIFTLCLVLCIQIASSNFQPSKFQWFGRLSLWMFLIFEHHMFVRSGWSIPIKYYVFLLFFHPTMVPFKLIQISIFLHIHMCKMVMCHQRVVCLQEI